MVKNAVYLFLVLIAISCAEKYPGFKEQDSGLYFKLLTLSDSERKIQDGDRAQLKIDIYFPNEDSLLLSKRMFLQFPNIQSKGGLVEAVSLLQEGELGEFIFSKEKCASNLKHNLRLLPDSVALKWQIQIDKIYSNEEFSILKEEFISWIKKDERTNFNIAKEEAMMDEFEHEKGLKFIPTGTGLRFIKLIEKNDNELSPFYGDNVKIEYDGYFLNGEKFNSTGMLDEGVQDFYLGQEMQVIKGLEEVLTFIKEGERYGVLLPSWLAFGKEGSTSGIVPKETPVYYEIALKEIN